MTIVFACRDRWNREVVLTRDVWDGHIVPRRPHLGGQSAAVRSTIEHPDSVKHDAERSNGECFYRSGIIPDQPLHVLTVVAKYVQEPGSALPKGYVLTAVSHRPRSPKSKERHNWP